MLKGACCADAKSMALLCIISAFTIIFIDLFMRNWGEAWKPFAFNNTQGYDISGDTIHTAFLQNNVDEDPTCLSRTQHYRYRRSSHITQMPPALLEAWSSYSRMHKSCFHHDWSQLFSNRDHQSDSQLCKYLVHLDGYDGLGNRLLSLVSAFAFAMATGRVLLIEARGGHLAKLLCEPFPGYTWVLPNDFPYADLESSPSVGSLLIHNTFNSTTVAHLKLPFNLKGADRQIFCEETYSSLQQVKWVAWSSNQYFLTNFFLVPSFWKSLHAVFGEHVDHIFMFISRLLLLPANETWAMILREYWSYLSCAKSRVGVQVRMLNKTGFDEEANQKVMQCLRANHLLPTFSEGEQENLSALHSRAEESPADTVVLVASLHGKYAERMRERFREVPTKGTKIVRVHTVSSLGHQDTGFQQAQLAFVEMWLLSFSDRLATTPFSTFGYIARGLRDLHPLILPLRDHGGSCMLAQSAEPCTHFPQTPGECLGPTASLSPQHKHWIRTHFRHCQDYEPGWQLIRAEDVPNEAYQIPFSFL